MNIQVISLIFGIVGAIVGLYWGPIGAATGAFIAWLAPIAANKLTETYRIKRKIIKTLSNHQSLQVRDIMRSHNIDVPVDCFPYSSTNPFVKVLLKYRQAILELEAENKIIHSKQASVNYGYVDPPNDWVNDWSGRVYQKTPD